MTKTKRKSKKESKSSPSIGVLLKDFKFIEPPQDKSDSIFDSFDKFIESNQEFGEIKNEDQDKNINVQRFAPLNKYTECDKFFSSLSGDISHQICKYDQFPILAVLENVVDVKILHKFCDDIKKLDWEDAHDTNVSLPNFQNAETLTTSGYSKLLELSSYNKIMDKLLPICLYEYGDNGDNLKIHIKPKRYLKSLGSNKSSLGIHVDTSMSTLILPLTDISIGGETVFPFYGVEFKQTVGSIIFFKSKYSLYDEKSNQLSANNSDTKDNNDTKDNLIISNLQSHGSYPLADFCQEKYILQIMCYYCENKADNRLWIDHPHYHFLYEPHNFALLGKKRIIEEDNTLKVTDKTKKLKKLYKKKTKPVQGIKKKSFASFKDEFQMKRFKTIDKTQKRQLQKNNHNNRKTRSGTIYFSY
jgi:hypothetical protein